MNATKQGISFSIVICTHNRSSYLDGLLTSLIRQTYPSDRFEVLFIDNASTDNTAEEVERLIQTSLVAINYVFEPQLGLSTARNTGARKAVNEIVVYIDDDAIAAPGWLEALAVHFQADPSIVCIGGRIELLWDVPRPGWLPESLEGYLGCNKFMGDRICEVAPGLSPFGGNYAIRRTALLAAPGFDPEFGRVGDQLGSNEENEMTDHLRRLGRIIYLPEAIVYHHVPPWRATKKYMINRGYCQGISNANLEFKRKPRTRIELLRLIIVNIVLLFKDFWKVIAAFFTKKRSESFGEFIFLVTQAGDLFQTLRLMNSKQKDQ